MAEMIGLIANFAQCAVGNPDALPMEIRRAGHRVARLFFWTRSWKERPVQNGHFGMPGRIRNGDREQTGVFVVHIVQFNSLIRTKTRQSQTPPVEKDP